MWSLDQINILIKIYALIQLIASLQEGNMGADT